MEIVSKKIITLNACTWEKINWSYNPEFITFKCHIARFPTELWLTRIKTCSFITTPSLWLNIKGKRQHDRFKRYCLWHWLLDINTFLLLLLDVVLSESYMIISCIIWYILLLHLEWNNYFIVISKLMILFMYYNNKEIKSWQKKHKFAKYFLFSWRHMKNWYMEIKFRILSSCYSL